jgi:hypothetical protein
VRAAAALIVVAALAACGAAQHPQPSDKPSGIVVIVAADAEWAGVRARFADAAIEPSPYGESFVHPLGTGVVFPCASSTPGGARSPRPAPRST